MKLIIQSDDYGMTKAVSLGCIEGIKNGVVRNTGMFANMPCIEECVELIKPYLDQIAFGIDLNSTTGSSLLNHDQIPSLTKENGQFYSSTENRLFDDEDNLHDHLRYHRDELYQEFKAQIEKYIALVGHKPDYIHNHAYGTETTDEVTRTLAKEYGVICTVGFMDREEVNNADMGWYVWGDAQKQISEDPITYITEDKAHHLEKEYGYIISHCGYVDAQLLKLTGFNTCRAIDLEAMTSQEVKDWIDINHIDLITFKDLPKEWI